MKRVLTYIPTFLVAAIILYLSLMRDVNISFMSFTAAIPHFDKIVHLLMYLALASIFVYTMLYNQVSVRKTIILGSLLPVVYGGVIELLQEYYFPPRTGDWFDWIADIIGVFIGCFAIIYLCRKKVS